MALTARAGILCRERVEKAESVKYRPFGSGKKYFMRKCTLLPPHEDALVLIDYLAVSIP
jgi:hypothetical protein